MGQPGTYRYQIAARDVDFASRPTLVAVTDYVLLAAGEDADRNGFGVKHLNADNWTWVLLRFCIGFENYPVQGEILTVTTWVSDVNRLMTTRNFTVTGGEGRTIGGAVSNWAMIDRSTRKAVDLSQHLAYADALVDRPSPVAPPEKLGAVAPARTMTHRVAYSDLDFNGHMNSLRYLALMADMMPLEQHRSPVKRMDINFLHEARYGEQLTVGVREPAFEIVNEAGSAVCRAQMEW